MGAIEILTIEMALFYFYTTLLEVRVLPCSNFELDKVRMIDLCYR